MEGCEAVGCEVEGDDDERSARSADERSMRRRRSPSDPRRPVRSMKANKGCRTVIIPTAHFSTSA